MLEVQSVPCSVSKELVESISNEYYKLYPKGKITIPAILFLLGFHIDQTRPNTSFAIYKDVLIRDPKLPYKVYKTDIYNGRVRKTVQEVVKGKIHYSVDEFHPMMKLFINTTVLTTDNLPEGLLKNILEIGDIVTYNNGLLTLYKKVNSAKTTRNIVRNK